MDDALALKAVLVPAVFLCLLVLERVLPAAQPPEADIPEGRFGWRRLSRNLGLWGINTMLSPMIVLPLSLWAASMALPFRDMVIPGAEDFWGGLIFDLLLLDLFIYWWHRLNHTLPFLWRFHEVHHLDNRLDASSAFRFHFGEVLLSAIARAGVVMLFGVDWISVLVFETLLLLAAMFHHSNLKLPGWVERPLSTVIVTPSIHWVHHHRKRQDTDSNYATVLSLWDSLFRSRSPKPRSPNMPIGTEGRLEQPLIRLLTAPFKGR